MEAEDDLFDLLIAGSPLPTRIPSVSPGSIKPRTEHEELMRYIPQPLQRFIEKVDNPPKDGNSGYTCAGC
ncbi:hypothetical protein PPACK8108_LOCUS24877 [Phakopsora pachyrhizi]|uniref:Uncharacterized protein n=1 Tax=Phakopsora pachyrhizi TaxID=170000 RepID=A0AAV0BTV5_PHAPC|nr:hypothetical protein PPACK8108_LOCUS24877 [Phakopsora pachyrhizi]